VDTPEKIRAYLGPHSAGSLVLMPNEDISLVIEIT
jgi:hypothetical protein